MDKKILIAYASKYGATKEIAEKIGKVLQDASLTVELFSAAKVKDIEQYDTIILGSAAYIGGWRKEAVKFLKSHQEFLKDKQVWIFSSGPTGAGDPVELLKGWQYPKDLEPIIQSIAPRDIAVFHGAVFPEKLNGLHRWMIQKVDSPVGDFRDWDMIAEWGEKIAAAQSAVPA